MSEIVNANPKDSGATPEQTDSVSEQESHSNDEVVINEDKVRYTTYKRAVDEVHKLKSLLEKSSGQLESLKLDKIEQEGEWKTGYEQQKVRGDSLEKRLADLADEHTQNALKGRIRTAAVQSGCSGDEQLNCIMDSLTRDDLDAIELNGLDPNEEDVKRLVEQKKKRLPFLFETAVPPVADRTPGGVVGKVAPKSVSDLSMEQKLEQLRNELSKQE